MCDIGEAKTAVESEVPLDQRVRIAAFRNIYRGNAPSVTGLAKQLSVLSGDIQTAVHRLVERGLATVDERGRVTGSHGLSLVPSDHRVSFDVGDRYVWCAVDAVGIPAALGVDAEIASRCFRCGEPVALTINGGQPEGPAAVLLLIGIGATGSSGSVIEDVCPTINFFCSRAHADAWAAAAGRVSIINVRQAAEIGRRQWADVR